MTGQRSGTASRSMGPQCADHGGTDTTPNSPTEVVTTALTSHVRKSRRGDVPLLRGLRLKPVTQCDIWLYRLTITCPVREQEEPKTVDGSSSRAREECVNVVAGACRIGRTRDRIRNRCRTGGCQTACRPSATYFAHDRYHR